MNNIRYFIENTKILTNTDFIDKFLENIIEEEINENIYNNKSIDNIINIIFEIHSSLKKQNLLVKRNAESALLHTTKKNKNEYKNEIEINNLNDIKLTNIKNMLTCVICQDFCKETITVKCCNQIYCYKCIIQWVVDNRNCPICRSVIENIDNSYRNTYIDKIITEIEKK